MMFMVSMILLQETSSFIIILLVYICIYSSSLPFLVIVLCGNGVIIIFADFLSSILIKQVVL